MWQFQAEMLLVCCLSALNAVHTCSRQSCFPIGDKTTMSIVFWGLHFSVENWYLWTSLCQLWFFKRPISAVFSCFGQSLPLPFVHTKKPDFYYLVLIDHTYYTVFIVYTASTIYTASTVFTAYTASTASPASTAWTTTTTPTRAPTGLREGSGYQIGWTFGKVSKGGWGSFLIQKYILQILGFFYNEINTD